MGEGAIFAFLVEFEKPDDGCKQDDWRFYEEVPLLLNPTSVKVKHDGVGRFVGIRDVCHEGRVYGIAPMAATGIIEIDDIELRQYLITLLVTQQMVVGNRAEVAELVVIDIHREALFDGLLDEVVHYGVRLTTTWRSEYV